MTRSRFFVVVVVVVVIGSAVLAISLRLKMRCEGFAGPEVSAADLPSSPAADGTVRVAHFNLRNFPLDDRAASDGLGFSRRTNICDLQAVLDGLDADLMGFVEVCDTRRFPPILRRTSGAPIKILFSRGGGRGGQHLAVAWDGSVFELVEGPVEIEALVVKPGLRPGLAVRLRSRNDPSFDFTVLEVHLDAGRGDLEFRLRQLEIVADWTRRWVETTGDGDVVLLGDFNTMGGTATGPSAELATADGILAGAGLVRLANATGCSQYWEGPGPADGVFEASLLDHVYLGGLEAVAEARSWLHCERLGCGELVSRPGLEDGTFYDVSDHCPVTFELRARR